MSGITGIYHPHGAPVDAKVAADMLASLAHRGPDGQALWREGPLALGHCLLHTTPESKAEQQPLSSSDGQLVLVADARLDNPEELMAQLGLRQSDGALLPDSALILAAYERWGQDCLQHILGDFAFVLWDGRRQELFAARDPVGIRSFYYHHSAKLFAFGTEIKALFRVPQLSSELDEMRVALFLAGVLEDQEITFYKEVRRLQASHCMVVDAKGMRIRRYWSWAEQGKVRLSSDAEYAEAFREQFTQAVHCRMRSAFPLGSTLSGGLDSSSIACLARDQLRAQGKPPLHTFSAIFPGLDPDALRVIDEREYVDSVLAGGGVVPHMIEADKISPLVDLQRVLWHQDEATLTPNLFIHWGMYQAAQQQGVRLLFDGLDGDTTVSHGYASLADLARGLRWSSLWRESRELAERSPNSQTTWSIAKRYGIRPLVPEFAWRFRDRLRGRQSQAFGELSMINRDFAQQVGLEERVRGLRSGRRRLPLGERAAHLLGLNSPLIAHAMEVADKATASCGMEGLYPFFDRRLMAFCLGLPGDQKLRHGWSRYILRQSMEKILPPIIQWRNSKADLSPSLRRGLWAYEADLLSKVIDEDLPLVNRFLDMKRLKAAVSRYASKNSNADAFALYGAVSLVVWLRDHFSSHSHSRPSQSQRSLP